MNGERFRVEVEWRDFADRTGVGQAVPLTGDTGYFWFFSPSNVELVIKVLDGRPLNNSFWVFYGALSNVEYTITVTDTAAGATKRYVNPSGQFASVGDTSAFPQGALAPLSVEPGALLRPPHTPPPVSNGIIEPASVAASEPTCLSHTQGLCLNSGRFAVEVDWKDFAGNEGRGRAVALSGDTGYFWFFSESNVELVVKALDARALGGGFWIFYGALSNVEYEITVVDTLTGVAKTYSNPSGQFASVGDTSAFRAGYSVAVSLDEGRAAAAEITPAGGELSATGADGSVYTLRVPPDALLSAQTITLTPVTSIDRLPLSGGLAAAVQLAPQGLLLIEPAILTVTPAAPVPPNEEISFAWRGSGEEFFLHPLQLDPSRASFSLLSLGGYGIGRGTPADQEAQLARVPGSPADELSQNLQPLVAQLRRQSGTTSLRRSFSPSDLDADLEATLRRHYQNRIRPSLEAASRRCGRSPYDVIWDALAWEVEVDQIRMRDRLTAEYAESERLILAVLERCYNDEYDRCTRRRDPRHGITMIGLYRLLEKKAVAGLVAPGKISLCMTFELTFFSRMEVTRLVQNQPLDTITEAVLVPDEKAVVLRPRNPLEREDKFVLVTDQRPVSSSCEEAAWSHFLDEAGCTWVRSCIWGGLEVERLEADLGLAPGISGALGNLSLHHRPLDTEHTGSWECPGDVSLPGRPNVFGMGWSLFHRDEHHAASGLYIARDWEFASDYRVRPYERTQLRGLLTELLMYHETTIIELRHSPRRSSD